MKIKILISFFLLSELCFAQSDPEWIVGAKFHYSEGKAFNLNGRSDGYATNLRIHLDLYEANVERSFKKYSLVTGLIYYNEEYYFPQDRYAYLHSLLFNLDHLQLPIGIKWKALPLQKGYIGFGLDVGLDFRLKAQRQTNYVRYWVTENDRSFGFHHLTLGIRFEYDHNLYKGLSIRMGVYPFINSFFQSAVFGEKLRYSRWDIYAGLYYKINGGKKG